MFDSDDSEMLGDPMVDVRHANVLVQFVFKCESKIII